ncbi:hypothetical protein C8T65DRAFT_724840 [Cerioporus squamosus]|nr:hypothetical protein C8T65DRAFT_724840 [Cerioporus squamosus]
MPKIRVPHVGFKKSAKKFLKVFFEKDANYKRIVEKAPHAVPGDRCWPQQAGANDENCGARFDWGERYQKPDGHWYRRINMQPNKNAADPTLKELGEKNSDMNLATIEIRADGKEHLSMEEFKKLIEDGVDAMHDECGL